VNRFEVIGADLKAGWHYGVPGPAVENFQGDGFRLLGMESTTKRK